MGTDKRGSYTAQHNFRGHTVVTLQYLALTPFRSDHGGTAGPGQGEVMLLAGPEEIGVTTQIVGICLQSGLGEEFFGIVCKRISCMERKQSLYL